MSLESFLLRSMNGAKYIFYLSVLSFCIQKVHESVLQISGVLFTISFGIAVICIGIPLLLKLLKMFARGVSFFVFSKKDFEVTLRELNYEQGDFSNAEEILKKGKAILGQIRKIQRWHKIMKFIGIMPINIEYYQYVIMYCHNILIDMKLDLSENIKMHQGRLQNGHREILKSTPDKNTIGVLSLQYSRLDDQIEQFEELQKVLVKI